MWDKVYESDYHVLKGFLSAWSIRFSNEVEIIDVIQVAQIEKLPSF